MRKSAEAAILLAAVAVAAGVGAQATRGVSKGEIVVGMHTDLSARRPPTACRRRTR